MQFFFYLFSFLIIFSALAAVLSKNPVHSVLYLIVTFLSAGAFFITMHAEFIAMVLIVVYVGAIAVLFLFIVMMLPIGEAQKSQVLSKNFFLGLCICSFVLFLLVDSWEIMPRTLIFKPPITINDLGRVLYTEYIYVFHLAGVILLLAMFASVSLTLHKTRMIKRQSIKKQIARSSEVKLLDMKSWKGVDINDF